MFCKYCGKELAEDVKFCKYCGNLVKSQNVEDNHKQEQELEQEQVQGPELITSDEKTEILEFDNNSLNQINPIETVNSSDAIDINAFENSESINNEDEKKTFDLKRSKVILYAIALLLVSILGSLLCSIFLFSGKNNIVKKHLNNNIFEKIDSTFYIGLYSAGEATDENIIKADIIFADKAAADGDYYEAEYSDEEDCYIVNNLEDGDYTITINADNYLESIMDVHVVDGNRIDIYLTPAPQQNEILYRVDWNGDQDIDLCAYDEETNDCISIGNEKYVSGGKILCDNDSNKKFELMYLDSDNNASKKSVYVVDSTAARDDIESTMEKDGVKITVYNSKGKIYSMDADPDKKDPLWCVGCIDGGVAIQDGKGYYSECSKRFPWAQYLKEGQIERFEKRLAQLNAIGSSAIPDFDPSADNCSPGERSDSNAWNSDVFYALEEHRYVNGYYDKNLCIMKKLQARNSLTGNIVDYDVYINPDTFLPNKIVSIEYLDSGIEVYEYYYDNDGMISFIFYYITDNYISTYATLDKSGQRYLFNNDTLTTWRSISPGKIVNYCYGTAENDRLSESSWSAGTIKEYSTLDQQGKAGYDAAEKKMINYAYNTYNMVMSTEGVSTITGIIYDGYYKPYSDADVEIYDKSFEHLLYTTKTNVDGEYQIYVPIEKTNYNLRVKGSKDEDVCDIYDVAVDDNSLSVYVDSAYFFDQYTEKQTVSLFIGDAFYGHGTSINGADIYVRRGINNKKGDIILSTTTDYNGNVVLSLEPGVYTIEASKSGYESIYYTVVSNPNSTNNYEYYTPPTLTEGEYAIVLSWGEYPADLDSHLFTNGGAAHVWYSDKEDAFNSFLDVDDTTSYGPETITIRSFNASNYYKYCVIDYTNSCCGDYGSYEMSYSNAVVTVYSAGGHVSTYHVPVNKSGTCWEVFEIRNGKLTPIQRYYDKLDDQSWWLY